MKFIVTDRESIQGGLLVGRPYIVISICDPGRRKAAVPRQAGFRGVLRVAFHDAEPTANFRLPTSIRLMTPRQADQIRRFVQQHGDEVKAIVVHCEQGMSRSPAVAAALCRAMGGDDSRFFRDYMPNKHVFQLMLAAATAQQRFTNGDPPDCNAPQTEKSPPTRSAHRHRVCQVAKRPTRASRQGP
jgi:predicted protein tyrosine phosphatase